MPTETTKHVLQRFLQVIFILLFQAAALFLAAGTICWVWGWAYLGVYVATMAAITISVLPRHPGLIAERGRVREDTKSWDKILAGLVSFFGPVTILILAGLDERFAWSPWMVPAWHYHGLAAMILGHALFAWAMAANAFFSGTVRIQQERGHTVAQGGPYRFVRHPGYIGMLLHTAGTPFLLGSYWALIPAGLTAGLLVLRTALEDRTLRAELPGYAEYAGRVRYRLIPGLW